MYRRFANIIFRVFFNARKIEEFLTSGYREFYMIRSLTSGVLRRRLLTMFESLDVHFCLNLQGEYLKIEVTVVAETAERLQHTNKITSSNITLLKCSCTVLYIK
jgi:hypothetical protein